MSVLYRDNIDKISETGQDNDINVSEPDEQEIAHRGMVRRGKQKAAVDSDSDGEPSDPNRGEGMTNRERLRERRLQKKGPAPNFDIKFSDISILYGGPEKDMPPLDEEIEGLPTPDEILCDIRPSNQPPEPLVSDPPIQASNQPLNKPPDLPAVGVPEMSASGGTRSRRKRTVTEKMLDQACECICGEQIIDPDNLFVISCHKEGCKTVLIDLQESNQPVYAPRDSDPALLSVGVVHLFQSATFINVSFPFLLTYIK
ncbi:hypothetical protein BDP27DRAFT_1426266 [Rhodocollybia butyracea]|uniref:Uncharacterized protein n=1 Tax=Rhodocollybia butyracea TaxID=206335 RepID=A0A9P5PL50_9AGAR|nr:hypothetical protein BDP27DRAFT_1426266 [Rhodocollybia butyracea]